MKVITYSSHGGNLPTAVAAKAQELGCNIRSDERLIAFIESFAGDQLPRQFMPDDQAYLIQHPNELLPAGDKIKKNGITRQPFLGYTVASKDTGFCGFARVTINEYNEATTKVHIVEYDGAEHLARLPEYTPDPNIPGLYHS